MYLSNVEIGSEKWNTGYCIFKYVLIQIDIDHFTIAFKQRNENNIKMNKEWRNDQFYYNKKIILCNQIKKAKK